jgi:hemerythrin-like domain-containing protein
MTHGGTMCEHCGCRGVEPLAELMDEHYALLDEGVLLTEALDAGDLDGATGLLQTFASHLTTHVRKEEDGVFAAVRGLGEFVDEVDALEHEHRELDAALAKLVVTSADFPAVLAQLLGDLEQHIERENLGIFPVSVVTLHAGGWELVEKARADRPTFLDQSLSPVGRSPLT